MVEILGATEKADLADMMLASSASWCTVAGTSLAAKIGSSFSSSSSSIWEVCFDLLEVDC